MRETKHSTFCSDLLQLFLQTASHTEIIACRPRRRLAQPCSNCPFWNPCRNWGRIVIFIKFSNSNNKDHGLISTITKFQRVWMNIVDVVIFFKLKKYRECMGLEESPQNSRALLALHTFSVIFAIFEKSLLSQFLSKLPETW